IAASKTDFCTTAPDLKCRTRGGSSFGIAALTAKGNFQASQTAKADSGYRVQSLPGGTRPSARYLKLTLGRARSATEEMRDERNHCANEQKWISPDENVKCEKAQKPEHHKHCRDDCQHTTSLA